MNLIDKARIDKYIESARWQNLKTYKKIAPHEYTIRWWNMELEEEFIRFVNYIRANRVKEWFYKSQYTYFYYNWLKYWTMGDYIDYMWVLNRTNDMKIY
jgi:hypothetical protein